MTPHPSLSPHVKMSSGPTSLSMASPPEFPLPVGLTPPLSAIRCSLLTTLGITPSTLPSLCPGLGHHPLTAMVPSCHLWWHLRTPLGILFTPFWQGKPSLPLGTLGTFGTESRSLAAQLQLLHLVDIPPPATTSCWPFGVWFSLHYPLGTAHFAPPSCHDLMPTFLFLMGGITSSS